MSRKRAAPCWLHGAAKETQAGGALVSTVKCTAIFADKKQVGEARGSVFYKRIHGSKHIQRRPLLRICNGLQVMAGAARAGVQWVEVLDGEDGQRCCAKLQPTYARVAPANHGYGAQLGLGMAEWTRACEPEQLRLWGQA